MPNDFRFSFKSFDTKNNVCQTSTVRDKYYIVKGNTRPKLYSKIYWMENHLCAHKTVVNDLLTMKIEANNTYSTAGIWGDATELLFHFHFRMFENWIIYVCRGYVKYIYSHKFVETNQNYVVPEIAMVMVMLWFQFWPFWSSSSTVLFASSNFDVYHCGLIFIFLLYLPLALSSPLLSFFFFLFSLHSRRLKRAGKHSNVQVKTQFCFSIFFHSIFVSY